jgi:hypothetical protein
MGERTTCRWSDLGTAARGILPGVIRGATWLLKNSLSGGTADIRLEFPEATAELTALRQPDRKSSPSRPAKPVGEPVGEVEAVPDPEPQEASPDDISSPGEPGVVEEPAGEDASEPSDEQVSGGAVGASSKVGKAFAALLSEDELAVQRDRMTNGPFRTAGDFSANSPGHWNEMAATMRLDFSSARWAGPQNLYDSSGPGPAKVL